MTDESDKIQSQRDDALAELSDVIEQARYKSLGEGRIRSPEKERIRLKYLRVIISALSTRRKYLADKDLEELSERLDRLEEHRDIDS
ncbi:hypothetical protein [Halobellus captivus]|uniref:hypothetical protein n=1 Tax=Halobellus captivus TaxID=2592614 RepID=UPI0011A98F1E|nr:hypothetical protein [Halobellus captivus]